MVEENLDMLTNNFSSVEWKSLEQVCEESEGAICDFDLIRADVLMRLEDYNTLVRKGTEEEEFDETSQSSPARAAEKSLLLLDPTIHITNPNTLIQLADTEMLDFRVVCCAFCCTKRIMLENIVNGMDRTLWNTVRLHVVKETTSFEFLAVFSVFCLDFRKYI